MAHKDKLNLQSFIQALKWPINNFVLSKAGARRHQVRIHIPKTGGHKIFPSRTKGDETLWAESGYPHRVVSFSWIGLLCSSNTNPCIKELVLRAELPSDSKIWFGPHSVVREGFETAAQYGVSKVFSSRVDYSRVNESDVGSANLLQLNAGVVQYPFRSCSTGVFHKEAYEALQTPPHSQHRSQAMRSVNNEFINVQNTISIQVAMLLDNDEIMAFNWNADNEEFEEDFFNVGLATG